MRDFKAFVQQQVARLALPADRERKIVEEWAAQLEDAYEGLRAEGLADEDAWRELQRQVPDWNALGGELLDAEPLLLRVPLEPRGGFATRAWRAVVMSMRETLTAGLIRDLRAGLRLLVKERGFSAAIILTLAICLGANAAVFAVVHAVLLRPLPVPEPDRLVGIGDVYPTITPNDILASDAPSYFDRLDAVTALEEQALLQSWFDTITFDGVPEEVRGMKATPSLFRVLRVPPALGRAFTDAEGEIWRRAQGDPEPWPVAAPLRRRPSVIGQTLRLGWTGQRYTIVGVMPAGFRFLDQGYDGHSGASGRDVQFWIPMTFTPAQKSDSSRDAIRIHSYRTSCARRHDRARPGPGRCASRRERQTISAVPVHRARHVHARLAVAGRDDARRPAHAVSALGRRRIRAADRRHQYREPGPGARQRTRPRARDAHRARRQPLPVDAATDRRGDGARRDRRRRRRGAGRGDPSGTRPSLDWTICPTRRRSAWTSR